MSALSLEVMLKGPHGVSSTNHSPANGDLPIQQWENAATTS